MRTTLSGNGMRAVNAGVVLYKLGEKVNQISLLIEGSVIVFNQGIKTIVGPGSFLGIQDLYKKIYSSNYVVFQNAKFLSFDVADVSQFRKIIEENSQYAYPAVRSLNRLISELSDIHVSLRLQIDGIYEFMLDMRDEYGQLCGNVRNAPELNAFNIEKYEENYQLDIDDVNYYVEQAKISDDIQSPFFGDNISFTYSHISRQAELTEELLYECMKMALYGKNLITVLAGKKNSYFKSYEEILGDISEAQRKIVFDLLYRVIHDVKRMDKLYAGKLGCKLDCDTEELETVYQSAIMRYRSESEKEEEFTVASEQAEEELRDSLTKILNYADFSESQKAEVRNAIQEFKNLKDKTAINDKARIVRKQLSEIFYQIYIAVYQKYKKQGELSKVVQMFLDYGFLDDTLLTKQQCVELYMLKDRNTRKNKTRVFTVRQWLDEIYEGRKEPSKNEFDLEYTENLREIKKYQNMTPEEEYDYLNNPDKKVEYEINNMFKYNNRLVNGQISSFVPVLYSDMINTSLEKLFLTTDDINMKIEQLLAIDYSLFHRRVMYYNEEKGIKKEYIEKQNFPDIILMPTSGSNSVMWQEIEGRRRDSSARFIFPIFVETDAYDLLVKSAGRFRFELCRTMEGISWNDIREKSLTSEYSDYIQSYTRNRELSEEQRKKIRQQTQKGRNNLREIFSIDYVIWVKNESQGYLRLNKIARNILATYCPFAKEIRIRISSQPLFKEAMSRFVKERQKKYRECSLNIKKLEKEGIEIPVELQDTLRFYSEL